MTSRDFAYWLQGYFEIHGKADVLTPAQVDLIKRHLNMVFIHEIDPSAPQEQQAALNAAHKPPIYYDNNPLDYGDELIRC